MKKNIFIGFTEIAGWGVGMREGFRRCGRSADFYCSIKHPFANDKNINFISRFLQWYYDVIVLRLNNNFLRRLFQLILELVKIPFLIYCLFKYETFYFISHRTILYKMLDLPVLKFFNKTIIILECGSEIRPPYISGNLIMQHSLDDLVKYTNKQKKKAVFIEKYVDYIVSIPSMALFHQKKCLLLYYLGMTHYFEDYASKNVMEKKNSVTILHAPSNSSIKGTSCIRQLIKELKQEGFDIEYIEVQGCPHSDVIDMIHKCDFIVDQMYSDTPMAGFAFEAAYYGKPAVVGGEYACYVNYDVPEDILPPSEFVVPGQVKMAIRKLICDKEYRLELGKRAYNYAHTKWGLEHSSKNFLKLADGDVPDKWWFYPGDTRFVFGGFMEDEKIKSVIRTIIKEYGVEKLCVNDKPDIVSEYMKLVKGLGE